MGKTKTIKEEASINAEFQEYLTKIQGDMAKKVADAREDFDANVDDYYQDADANIIAAGEKWHFRQTHETGVEGIRRMIQNTVDCLFGGIQSEDSPGESVGSESLPENIVEAFKLISAFKSSAANFATAVIVGSMQLFSTEIEIKFDHQYTSTPLAPGLTLHLLVANDSYSNEKFLDGERIVEGYVRFKLIYSFKKADKDYGVAEFNAQAQAIHAMRADVLAASADLVHKIASHEITLATARSLKEDIAFSKEMLDEAQGELDRMIERYAPDAKAVAVRALPLDRRALSVLLDPSPVSEEGARERGLGSEETGLISDIQSLYRG